MIIAVDFDGTIVEHKYPRIGRTKLFAFETLKQLHKEGHQLILWTYRAGKELKEAVEFCKKNGIEFYAVNRSYKEELFDENKISRKIYADIYIDDRNIGGFLGWSEIWKMIIKSDENQLISAAEKKINKTDFSQKFKGLFRKN